MEHSARGELGRAIAITSGKGGVGKSTVSLNLALALRRRGALVGLLDADIYGPDIPLMLNLKQTRELKRWLLGRSTGGGPKLEPVERHGLRVMSVGFLIAEHQSLTLPSQLLHGALRQLLADVEWGPLDYLVIDLPPGTADLQQELVRIADLAGAVIVVGPQDVAHLDARKLLEMLRAADVRVLGGVENMARFACPHCGEQIDAFPRVAEERSLWAQGVDALASIPLDPAYARSGDGGAPVLVSDPGGPQAAAYARLAERVVAAIDPADGGDTMAV